MNLKYLILQAFASENRVLQIANNLWNILRTLIIFRATDWTLISRKISREIV